MSAESAEENKTQNIDIEFLLQKRKEAMQTDNDVSVMLTKKLSQRDKRHIAYQLRIMGHSLKEIAARIGMKSASGVATLLAEARKEVRPLIESREDTIQLERELLERLMAVYAQRAVDGSIHAAGFVLKALERRAKLLGLDAPTKQEIMAKQDVVIETDWGDGTPEIAESSPDGEE